MARSAPLPPCKQSAVLGRSISHFTIAKSRCLEFFSVGPSATQHIRSGLPSSGRVGGRPASSGLASSISSSFFLSGLKRSASADSGSSAAAAPSPPAAAAACCERPGGWGERSTDLLFSGTCGCGGCGDANSGGNGGAGVTRDERLTLPRTPSGIIYMFDFFG